MCGGGGSSQQPVRTIPPPAAPAPGAAPPTAGKPKPKRGGRRGTILTSAQGIKDEADTQRKTVLGG